jgi:hypothetical protein
MIANSWIQIQTEWAYAPPPPSTATRHQFVQSVICMAFGLRIAVTFIIRLGR